MNVRFKKHFLGTKNYIFSSYFPYYLIIIIFERTSKMNELSQPQKDTKPKNDEKQKSKFLFGKIVARKNRRKVKQIKWLSNKTQSNRKTLTKKYSRKL